MLVKIIFLEFDIVPSHILDQSQSAVNCLFYW